MSISIRSATSADSRVIADFNDRMAMETENETLDNNLIVPGVSALLHDASKGRYWVALAEDRIVGQIMVTYEWSDWRNGPLWWMKIFAGEEYFPRCTGTWSHSPPPRRTCVACDSTLKEKIAVHRKPTRHSECRSPGTG